MRYYITVGTIRVLWRLSPFPRLSSRWRHRCAVILERRGILWIIFFKSLHTLSMIVTFSFFYVAYKLNLVACWVSLEISDGFISGNIQASVCFLPFVSTWLSGSFYLCHSFVCFFTCFWAQGKYVGDNQ